MANLTALHVGEPVVQQKEKADRPCPLPAPARYPPGRGGAAGTLLRDLPLFLQVFFELLVRAANCAFSADEIAAATEELSDHVDAVAEHWGGGVLPPFRLPPSRAPLHRLPLPPSPEGVQDVVDGFSHIA